MTYTCIVIVRDENQQGMADVLVKLIHHFNLYEVTSGYTDDKGRVKLTVSEGTYRIYVEKEGYQQINFPIFGFDPDDKKSKLFTISMKKSLKAVEVKIHIREWDEKKHKDAMSYIYGAEVVLVHQITKSEQRKIAYAGIVTFECEENAEYSVYAIREGYEQFYTPSPFKATQGLDYTYYLRKKAEVPPTPTLPPAPKEVNITIHIREWKEGLLPMNMPFVLNATIELTCEKTKITRRELALLGMITIKCTENQKYTLSVSAEGFKARVPPHTITAIEGLTHTVFMDKITAPTPKPTPAPAPTPKKYKLEIIVRNVALFPLQLIPSIIAPLLDLPSRIANADIEIYSDNVLITSGKTNTLGLCQFTLDGDKVYSVVVKKDFYEMVQSVSIDLKENIKTNVWMKPLPLTITDKLGNSLKAISEKEKEDIYDFFGLPDKKDINTYLTDLLKKAKAHRLLDKWRDYWLKIFGEHTFDKDIKLNFVKTKYSEFFNKLGSVETIEALPCKIKVSLINKENLIPVSVKFFIEATYNMEVIYKSKIYDVMLFRNIPYLVSIEATLKEKIIPKNVDFTIYVYHLEVKDEKLITKTTSIITY